MWLVLCAVAQLTTTTTASAPPPWAHDGVDLGEVIDGLSLEQKVGQTLLLGFGGTIIDGTIERFIDDMQPGGVALFTRNINGPEQTMTLIRGLRERDPKVSCRDDAVACPSAVPMFVAVDQEGGSVVRLKSDAVILPSAMALGAADDPELAYRVGRALGEDLVMWGFNMNLAPVLDVNSNPKNPVIGVRSFGGDPNRVADIGVGYITGLQDAGVVAVAKHFPGHGDTDTDSHYALPVLQHDLARLNAIELRPFARAFSSGLQAIMTAHIALPLVAEGKDVPATVSGKVLTGVLREDLGWDGLVITDGLEMQGIIERYGAGEAAVRAIVAGADMVMVLWFPEKKLEVQRALIDAVKSGRLPMARLDQAVRRVLEHKARAGLFSKAKASAPKMASTLTALRGHDRSALQETVERAITVVRNNGDVLPLKKSQKVVVAAAQTAFVQGLSKRLGAKAVGLPWAPTRERTQKDAARVVSLARSSGADVVVIGMHTGDHIAIVRAVEAALPKVKVVVVSFGSPWLLNAFPHSEATVCAFGWRDDSAAAAAAVVAGALPARGHLPVALAGGTSVPANAGDGGDSDDGGAAARGAL